jgi:hypothetical protein
VLGPLVAGNVWCLVASVTVAGGPGSYYLPEVSFSGYVAAGTLPAGAVAAPAGGALQPRRVTAP